MRNIIIERINELGFLLRKAPGNTYEYRQIDSILRINMSIWEAIK